MLKLRFIPWLFGVALILTMLAGGNCLMNSSDGSSGAAPPAPPKSALSGEGLIAKGTVYSDPPTFPVTLPAHLAAGKIAKVHVKSGQSVQANEPLISFDDTLLNIDLNKAQNAYMAAYQEYKLAEEKQADHSFTIEGARIAQKSANNDFLKAKETYTLASNALKKDLELWRDPNNGTKYTPEQLAQKMSEDSRLSTLQGLVDKTGLQVQRSDNDLKQAEKAKETFSVALELARNRAAMINAEVDKAKQAVKDCVVVAKMPGTIEQVSAAEGVTVYPQSKPLFYFVPAGPRIVHAEIVPDFAHRIKNRVDKEVQITDDSNTHLVYKGIVRRVPDAFLPKPNGAPDLINGKSNLVLIVEIEVVDAHPKDLPPLRVGQPVRVIFP